MIADARPLSRLEAKRQEQTPQALARLVVVGLFICLWFVLLTARIPMPVPFLLVLLAEVTFFVIYLRTVPLLPSVRAIEIAQYVMLAAEIGFHTTIVYFLGGISWLGSFAYVFGLIFANTFLDIRRGLFYTAGASGAFIALMVLEATGAIPHYVYMEQGALRYEDARFVATTAVGGFGVFFSIYLWVNWVGYQLHRERDAALRAQDDLLKARGQLQKSNEELERRVQARTAELVTANAALRASEEKLRAIIGGAPVVLFATDKEGVFTLSEGTGLEALGLEPGQVVGQSVFDVYRDAPEIAANIWSALGGQSLTATVDVGLLSFETHYAPIRDEDGLVSGVIGVATDVTERRRAERALRESEQRLRAVVSNAPVVLFALDADGVFTLAEGRALDELGIDPGRVIGRSAFEIYRDSPDAAEAARRALAGEQTTAIVETDRLALDTRMGPVFGPGGEVLGVTGVATNISERRQTERELEKLRRRNELILDSAGEGIYGIDLEGRGTFANPSAARFIGWEPNELIGRPLHDLLHHSYADGRPYPAEACPIYAAFRDGTVHQVTDDVFWRKDGSSFPVEYMSTPIRDERGEVMGAVVTFKDITERRRAEEALRQHEQILRSTIESTGDAILVLKDDWQIAYANERFAEMWRLPTGLRERRDIREWLDFAVHQVRDPDALLARVERVYPSGREETFETIELRDGRIFEEYTVPLDLSSELRGRVVCLRDVTERKRAEDALRESEEKFRTMAETVTAATFIFQDTRMRYVNSAAEAISGYSRDELLAMDFWDVIHPEFRDLVKERGLLRQAGEDVPGGYEVKLLTKDGAEKWVDFTAGIIDFEGRPAVLGTAFDITERKRFEQALHDAANHDPLTGVLNRRAGIAALRERLEHAKNHGGRYAALVLDLDRFKSINDNYSHETGDNALLLFTNVMRESVEDHDVICRLGGDEFEIGLDAANLEQALLHAERLQQSLRHAQERDDTNCPSFSVSIGIACYPEEGNTVMTLGRRADEAMYAAKAAGGNRYRAWRHLTTRNAA